MKLCPKCKTVHSLDMFNKNAKRKDGLQAYCKKCKNQYQKANPNRKASVDKYREANHGVCLERTRLSQAKKPMYYAQKSAEWVNANRDRHLANRRKLYSNNRAKDIARVRERKNRLKQLVLAPAYQAEIDGIYLFTNIFKGYEVDHIVPLNGKLVSGLHVPCNLQVLTVTENRRKGNKYEIQ